MKKFLKLAVVIGATLIATTIAKAQIYQPPLIFTGYPAVNGVGGGLVTNGIITTPTAGTTNSSAPLTNVMFNSITNLSVTMSFNASTNPAAGGNGGTVDFTKFAYCQLQGSPDWAYWYGQGSSWYTNATWVTDPLLLLAVPVTATNVYTAGTNFLGMATNGTFGSSNFNISKYTGIRIGSLANGTTNIGVTNVSVLFFWRPQN